MNTPTHIPRFPRCDPYEINRFTCGCRILSEHTAGLGVKTIEYCPLHRSAPALVAALEDGVKMAASYRTCDAAWRQHLDDFVEQARAALAAAKE